MNIVYLELNSCFATQILHFITKLKRLHSIYVPPLNCNQGKPNTYYTRKSREVVNAVIKTL